MWPLAAVPRASPATSGRREGAYVRSSTAWFACHRTCSAHLLKQPAPIAPIVCVVDDDISMREALSALIEVNGMRAECFASAREFLRRGPSGEPMCLVLDVSMPDIGGFELQRELIVSGRNMPVIFITAHGDIPMAVRAIKAGASEFLPKPVRGEDLVAAIHLALERDQHARKERAELSVIRKRHARLTEREAQVFTLIAGGKLNKQIAAELGVSENTVKAHRKHVMQKMGATSFAALVRMMDRLL